MSSVKYLFHKKLLKMFPKKCTLQNCLEKLWIPVDGLSALQHRHRASKGSTFEISVTSIWALPVRGGGSKPLPEWFGALF